MSGWKPVATGVRSLALPEATWSGGRNAAAPLAEVPAAEGLVQGLLPRSPADAGEVRALRQPWQAGLNGRIRAGSAEAFSPRRCPCRDAPATPAGRAASRARAGFAPPRPGVRPEGPAAPRSPAAERPRPSACTPPLGRPATLGPAHCADACRTVRNASAAVPDAAASAPPRSRRKPTMPCPHGSRTMAHMSHGSGGGLAPQASSFPPLPAASLGEGGGTHAPPPATASPEGVSSPHSHFLCSASFRLICGLERTLRGAPKPPANLPGPPGTPRHGRSAARRKKRRRRPGV